MKYKVGQKVWLKSLSKKIISDKPRLNFEGCMDKYFGTEVTITNIIDRKNYIGFFIKEDNEEYIYNINWINNTIVKLPEDLFKM